MFLCRLALALGMFPSDVAQMPAQDFDLMGRYYAHEPWGAVRDNMHAGMIAAEIRNKFRGENAPVSTFNDFMLMDAETHAQRRAERSQKSGRMLWSFFDSIAPKKGD